MIGVMDVGSTGEGQVTQWFKVQKDIVTHKENLTEK